MSFTYVDLFAGCGGLSLGLESAGGKLLAAVERSPMAAETFFHNLIEPISSAQSWADYLKLGVGDQLKKRLIVKEIATVLNDTAAISLLTKASPDVVVGGPPCQGFSLAGKRNPDDARNSLPWQFLALVEQTAPKVVVIENVVGMRHKFGDEEAHVFDQLLTALSQTTPGYVVQALEVNALHYGAPQHRPRLMLIGVRRDVAKAKSLTSTGSLWKSNFIDNIEDLPDLAPLPTIESGGQKTVRDALTGLPGFRTQGGLQIKSYNHNWGVLREPAGTTLMNHNVRQHRQLTVKRFGLYQVLASSGLDSRTISTYTRGSAVEKAAILSKIFDKVTFPLTTPSGLPLAATRADLEMLMENTKTKKHSQRVLNLDQPARTVVTIGDDYVHPVEPRTFTVRELARFQGFPDSYEFRSKETTGGLNRRNEVPQYSQVGNAVSPLLSLAIGKLINQIVDEDASNMINAYKDLSD